MMLHSESFERAIAQARNEADYLMHQTMLPELLLLGILSLKNEPVTVLLTKYGVSSTSARRKAKSILGEGNQTADDPPFSLETISILLVARDLAITRGTFELTPIHFVFAFFLNSRVRLFQILNIEDIAIESMIEAELIRDLGPLIPADQQEVNRLKIQIDDWDRRAQMAGHMKNDRLHKVAIAKKQELLSRLRKFDGRE